MNGGSPSGSDQARILPGVLNQHGSPARIPLRSLGRSGLRISELGFGCSSFWAKPSFSERTAIELVERAAELGCNYFDTGPSYGGGEAERRLGRALRSSALRGAIVSTKVGTHINERGERYRDFTAAAVRRSVEHSLGHLGLESISILLLHGPELDRFSDELIRELERLKSAGKCGLIGVNSFSRVVLDHTLTLPFDGVMLQYNVIDQSAGDLLNAFSASGRFVICGTPLGQALYRFSTFNPFSARGLWYLLRAVAKHRSALFHAQRLRFLNRLEGMSATQAALRFVLDEPAISCAVFGTTSRQHLEENIDTCNRVLPPEVRARLFRALERT